MFEIISLSESGENWW